MYRLSMPLLYSLFGEPLIVTLIFLRSGKMNFFRISCACRVRLHKQQENALYRSSLGVDCYVYSFVICSVDRHHFIAGHVIIGKL